MEIDMKTNEIKENLFSIINENSAIVVSEENVDKIDLFDDCGYDSIRIIELVCSIEDFFSIVIEDDYLVFDNIRNVGAFFEYVIKLVLNC